jgi:hypothetical protein
VGSAPSTKQIKPKRAEYGRPLSFAAIRAGRSKQAKSIQQRELPLSWGPREAAPTRTFSLRMGLPGFLIRATLCCCRRRKLFPITVDSAPQREFAFHFYIDRTARGDGDHRRSCCIGSSGSQTGAHQKRHDPHDEQCAGAVYLAAFHKAPMERLTPTRTALGLVPMQRELQVWQTIAVNWFKMTI